MLLSIITINYNNLAGLKKTVTSVLNQSYDDVEYIIIDGGSVDGSKTYIESCQQDINYWVSEPDSGIYNAMNKGVYIAKGKYLLFLNSGDMLCDNLTLSDATNYLEDAIDICYGDLNLLYENKKTLKTFPDKLSFSFFSDNGYLPHPATFIKRSLFNTVHLYNEEFKIVADWDFLVCAICKHNATYKHINRVISVFDKQGVSNKSESLSLMKQEKKKSLEKNFPLFLEDAERLVDYEKKFKLNRFKMLSALETNSTVQKLNSIWLVVMTKLFGKRYK